MAPGPFALPTYFVCLLLYPASLYTFLQAYNSQQSGSIGEQKQNRLLVDLQEMPIEGKNTLFEPGSGYVFGMPQGM